MASKPRTGIPGVPGLSKVVNESAYGVAKAEERYGKSDYAMGRSAPAPEIKNKPQRLGDPNNMQGPKYDNIVDSNSWLRGGGSNQAEGKPNFHPGYKGKR